MVYQERERRGGDRKRGIEREKEVGGKWGRRKKRGGRR